MLEFAGNNYIYLSKLKKDKIRKIRESEKENKDEAPIPKLEKQMDKMIIEEDPKNINEDKKEVLSDDSDDAYLVVNSSDFNIDLVHSQIHNNNMMNQQAAPGLVFKKAIDTNVCLVRFNSLEKQSDEILPKLYKCQKCE